MHLHVRIIVGLLACGLLVSAQSWDTLRRLNPGDRVKVRDVSGQEHKGAFVSLSADNISITTGKSEMAIERSRVRRVELRSGSRRARNAMIGAGIGFAIGLIVDQTAGAYFRNEFSEGSGARAITYIAPTALFGGVGGAFPAYRTVYRAP
ncbi:MAG: hypothetical protein DMG59_11005 [Acidobacteria bacterium]|nr:MAG: hypothetical protein DMG59_11005 [Acidobacteriota bacterium]